MSFNFESLLAASKSNEDVNNVFQEDEKPEFKRDERYFKLNTKNNRGKAILRFMPHPEKTPTVKMHNRFIKFQDKYFVENSRGTLGEDDPMDKFYFAAYKQYEKNKTDENQKLHRMLKRRDRFISLVYVIQDDVVVDGLKLNEGKTFLFDYGKEIKKIIEKSMEDQDEFGPKTSINPFTLGENGGDFRLVMTPNSDGGNVTFGTYENSNIVQGAFMGGDQDAWKNMFQVNKDSFYDIHKEVSPDKFKSYDELEKRAIEVFGNVYTDLMGTPKTHVVENVKTTGNDVDDEIPEFDEKSNDETPNVEQQETKKKEMVVDVSGDDFDPEDFFGD